MICASSNQAPPMQQMTQRQSAGDQLGPLTLELYGTPGMEEDAWNQLAQQVFPNCQAPNAQTITSAPSLMPQNVTAPPTATAAAVQKWERSVVPPQPQQQRSVAPTRKRASKPRKGRLAPGNRKHSKKGMEREASGRFQAIADSKVPPSRAPKAAPNAMPPPLPNVTMTAPATAPMTLPPPQTSAPNPPRSSTSLPMIVEPVTFMKELFDEHIAPNFFAPSPNALTLKQCIYKKLFIDFISKDVASRTTPLVFEDLYLIALSALETIGVFVS